MKLTRPSLRILTYHRVDTRFGAHLRILAACGRLVTVSEGLRRLAAGDSKRLIAITFDDIYAQVHDQAYLRMKQRSLPGTIFVATGCLAQGSPFWWDRVNLIFAQTSAAAVSWEGCHYRLNGRKSREHLSQCIRASLRRRNPAEIDHALNNLQCELACESLAVPAGYRPATWPQIAEMARGGFEIGAHTVNHPCLTSLGDEAVLEEIRTSKQRLRRELDCAVAGLAYPFGGIGYFDSRIQTLTREAGYEYALTTVPGVNRQATDRFSLRRFTVRMDESPLRVLVKVLLLGGIL